MLIGKSLTLENYRQEGGPGWIVGEGPLVPLIINNAGMGVRRCVYKQAEKEKSQLLCKPIWLCVSLTRKISKR